jgi:type I restriction enzyme S subunit
MSDGNGALPDGWARIQFGEAVTLKRGYDLPTQSREAGTVPIFAANGPVGTHKEAAVKAPGVVTGRSGTIGKVHYVEEDFWPLNTALYVQDFHGSDPKFVAWLLRQTDLKRFSSSTAVPTLNRNNVHKAEINLPPLAEQRRIVSKIESLQERSSRARRALSEVGPLLEQFRQSVLRAAFSGRLTADWRAAHRDVEPATELLSRIRTERRHRWEQAELAKYEAKGKQPPKNWQDKYKEPAPVDDGALPELPDGWCWSRFEEVLDELRNGVSPKPSETPPGTPLLRINSVRSRTVTLDEYRYLPDAGQFLDVYRIKDGDLLFTRYNGSIDLLGVCGMVRGLDDRVMLYPDKLMRVRFDHDDVIPEFVELYFASPGARSRVTQKAKTTSGQQGVSGGDIKAQPLVLAPIDEQREIVRRVRELLAAAEATVEEAAESESALTQLDQSILAKAFRGELVPQDPRDEPASELLARIRTTREAGSKVQRTRKTKAGSK